MGENSEMKLALFLRVTSGAGMRGSGGGKGGSETGTTHPPSNLDGPTTINSNGFPLCDAVTED